MVKQIDVVGAVIEREGQILCARRGGSGPLAGLWEFPGGKTEPHELPRDALTREIAEELHCTVDVGELVTTTVHQYDFATISLTTFHCSLVKGEPVLTEHVEVRWLRPSDLFSVEWAPADVPAVAKVMARHE